MNPLDYFAGLAMQAFLMREKSMPEPIGFCFDGKQLAEASYHCALAMVRERTKVLENLEKPEPTKKSSDGMSIS